MAGEVNLTSTRLYNTLVYCGRIMKSGKGRNCTGAWPSLICSLVVHHSSLHLPIGSLWRSVLLGEGLQLKWVEGIFPTAHVLHGVLSSTSLTAHAVKGLCEDLWGHAVLLLQNGTLLQCDWHGRAVLGTLTASHADAIETTTNLCGLPKDVHILALPGMNIVA